MEEVLSLCGADTSAIVHRRSVLDEVSGWDERCRWLEDWDSFLRVCLASPGRVQWVPEILLEYRQVHGDGADGICAEAREARTVEFEARQYLLQKWQDRLTAEGAKALARPLASLRPVRARPDAASGQRQVATDTHRSPASGR